MAVTSVHALSWRRHAGGFGQRQVGSIQGSERRDGTGQAKNLAGREVPYAVLMYIWTDQVPVGTVMSRLHRGKKLLKKLLTDYARQEGYDVSDSETNEKNQGVA